MDKRNLRAIGDALGRLMAEVKGIPDEESNFPAFRPTCREVLLVKPWQADLQPGDYFIGYYASIDLFLNGEVLVDKESRREGRPFLRYARVCSDAGPGGEYGLFHVSNAVARIDRSQFKLFERQGWHPANQEEVVEMFYNLHDDSTPEGIAQEVWQMYMESQETNEGKRSRKQGRVVAPDD